MIDTTSKQSPFGQYEYVDVYFSGANIDTVIPYTRLRPESPEDVRWLDVKQGGLAVTTASRSPSFSSSSTTTSSVPIVYRAVNRDGKAFGAGYIVLRCTLGEYSTRLLLFVERREA